ncbi:ribonuclease H-like domain-containing protein [Tanacetum coccineum]
MAFVSSPSSINEVNTANVQVSTANSSVSTNSTLDSTANLSDAIVYAFLANQPNGSQLVHEDLEQIHEDDLKEMDLKWQLALLSMRARRYYQRTGKKITINGSDTIGYDKSKVECFNCHKMGHFARECRSPRNQESRPRNRDNGNINQDSSRRTVNVEETSSKEMVAIDGAGFDWSFMAEEEVTTNMELMAFSDSELYNDKTCSNTCLKSFETLKTQLDNLRVEFNKSEFNLATYKRGLASVEEQLVFYKKNEVMFSDQIVVLKRDASFKDSEIIALKEFQQPEFEGYGPKASKSVCVDTSNEVKTTPATPLVRDLVSEKEKQTVFPTKIEFIKQHDKTARKPVKLIVNTIKGKGCQKVNTAKAQAVNTARPKAVNTARPKAVITARPNFAVVNIVRANQANDVKASALRGGKITGKGTLKTGKLDFQDVFFVNELQFNLCSVSQMCDKKKCVLFTDTQCFVLSPNFKLPDESQILLKIPRKNNMYSVDMKNIVPKESLTYLVAKATLDESMLWHRRLGHVNFKTINKLVKDNLVRGLPSKCFENDQTCTKPHNRVIIVKPHNKTPYELFRGRTPSLSFMRPFGCHVSILNTLDHLGKFDGKSDDGFSVRYSLTSKAFRVYNIRTRRVEKGTDIQKESQKRPSQAWDGKDKVKS